MLESLTSFYKEQKISPFNCCSLSKGNIVRFPALHGSQGELRRPAL